MHVSQAFTPMFFKVDSWFATHRIAKPRCRTLADIHPTVVAPRAPQLPLPQAEAETRSTFSCPCCGSTESGEIQEMLVNGYN